MQLRLQKYLSEQGICSRRQAEKLIVEGKIFVNGKPQTVLGTKIDPDIDKIAVNNTVIKQRNNLIYIAINKPVGIVTSCYQPDSKTIVELVNLRERVYPIGRLDKDSSGLLILTNDGILAYRLSHPKFNHEKEYVVSLEKRISEGALDKLRRGMTIDGVKTQPAKVVKVGEH
ncbi:MAG: rRNA pseudouridine synthase, partial [Chlamydiae bacterium]